MAVVWALQALSSRSENDAYPLQRMKTHFWAAARSYIDKKPWPEGRIMIDSYDVRK